MTADQTRYRIVCADGTEHDQLTSTPDGADGMAMVLDVWDDCGEHRVEPVAPDPTCAQSSCIHCRNGKPGACPVRPYPGTVAT